MRQMSPASTSSFTQNMTPFRLPHLGCASHCFHHLQEQKVDIRVATKTLISIAADPKHLGARIEAKLVLHT